MSSQTLFERVGGASGIDALVVDFYNRVLADPDLGPFFEGVDTTKLRAMQREFFSAALGGSITYTGKPIYEAHYGRGIKRRHFAAFVDHLLATLQSFELSEREVSDIIGRINTYIDEVVGGHGLAG